MVQNSEEEFRYQDKNVNVANELEVIEERKKTFVCYHSLHDIQNWNAEQILLIYKEAKETFGTKIEYRKNTVDWQLESM